MGGSCSVVDQVRGGMASHELTFAPTLKGVGADCRRHAGARLRRAWAYHPPPILSSKTER